MINHMKHAVWKCLLIVSLIVSVSSCTDENPAAPTNPTDPEATSPRYNRATYPGVTWTEADPIDVNMSQAQIDQSMNYAFTPGRNTQSVLVIRHGVIVAERYATFPNNNDNGEDQGTEKRDKNSTATTWSTAKSIISAVLGIAVNQNFISSISESASNYLPAWVNTANNAVTIRHLLEMRSNLVVVDRPGWIYGSATVAAGIGGNQLAYSLQRELAGSPGTTWSYSNEDSMLLGAIIENATGMHPFTYADVNLFSKIGMEVEWWLDTEGNAMTYCCIDATARSLARFGLLFARDGKWGDEQIVPAQWVKDSTAPIPGVGFYGYQWWVRESDNMYSSQGLHDNDIYIFPDKDLVILRNSYYEKLGDGSTVRTGKNGHYTLPPSSWDDFAFFQPIVLSTPSE